MTETRTAEPNAPNRTVDFTAMRRAMVESQLRPSNVSDPVVIAAMAIMAREAFVEPDQQIFAYMDRAVPLGDGRALNPALVAGLFLTRAELTAQDKVLVVAAGTGYLSALLSGIVETVAAVEENNALFAKATANLADHINVSLVAGPMAKGYAKQAPYSVIFVDGAVEELPDIIVDQLADDGRLLAGVVEEGVTRLALGRKSKGAFRLVAFADSDIAPLSNFAKPRTYQF